MTAIVKQLLMGGVSRWPCRGPFCYKGSSNLQGQGDESSQMLSPGLTAAMESPGGVRTGTSRSPWGKPASPLPGAR